jgi:hypothetical protein
MMKSEKNSTAFPTDKVKQFNKEGARQDFSVIKTWRP